MKTVEIRDSTMDDVFELGRSMRQEDKNEAIAQGIDDPTEGLYYSYTHSIYRKTALIDGKVAAMWGVAGDLFGYTGRPYFITGEEVYKISPLQFSRIYRQEAQAMRQFFPVLENYVDASYKGAVRMLEIAGFDLSGPHFLGPNESLFYKFSMVGI